LRVWGRVIEIQPNTQNQAQQNGNNYGDQPGPQIQALAQLVIAMPAVRGPTMDLVAAETAINKDME